MTDVIIPFNNGKDSAIIDVPQTNYTVQQNVITEEDIYNDGSDNNLHNMEGITGEVVPMSSELLTTKNSVCECGKIWREFNTVDISDVNNHHHSAVITDLVSISAGGTTNANGRENISNNIISINVSPESAACGEAILRDFARPRQRTNYGFSGNCNSMFMKKIDLVQKYYEDMQKLDPDSTQGTSTILGSMGRTSLQTDSSSNISVVPTYSYSTDSGKNTDAHTRDVSDYQNSNVHDGMIIPPNNSSTFSFAKEYTKLKKVEHSLKNNIHILVPAPPPSWSGCGMQGHLNRSAKLLQSTPKTISSDLFPSGKGEARVPSHQMVTIVPSPYYTSKSAKDAKKAYERKISENMCPQIVNRNSPRQPNIDAADVKGNHYGREDINEGTVKAVIVVADKERCANQMTSGAGQISINKKNTQSNRIGDGSAGRIANNNCSLVLELKDKADIDKAIHRNICNRGGAINNTEMISSQEPKSPLKSSTNSPGTPKKSKGYFGTVCMASTRTDGATVTVTPHPPNENNTCKTVVASVHGIRGTPELAAKGQELHHPSSPSLIGSPSEKGPALFIPVCSGGEYKNDTIVSAAVRQELETDALGQSSNEGSVLIGCNIPNFQFSLQRTGDPSSDATHNSVGLKEDNLDSPGYVFGNMGVRIDLGRDRVMCSSPRYGFRAEDICQSSDEVSRRVEFATDMAPSLVIAGPQLRQRANKAFEIDNTEKGHVLGDEDGRMVLGGSLDQSQAIVQKSRERNSFSKSFPSPKRKHKIDVGFLSSSPRFSGEFSLSCMPNHKCPPVGHYNPRHEMVDSNVIRDVYLNGRIPYKLASAMHIQEEMEAKRLDEVKKDSDNKKNNEDREKETDTSTDKNAPWSKNSGFPTSSFASRCPRMPPDRKLEGHDGEVAVKSNNKPIGESPTILLGYNEAFISKNKRVINAVDMAHHEVSRDRRPGWDHGPNTAGVISSETHYTGPLRGDSMDARARVKSVVQMDLTPGRGARQQTHENGNNNNLSGINTLDFCDVSALDGAHTSKFKNVIGHIDMTRQAARKDNTLVANNVSSDSRTNALGVVYDGSGATKSQRQTVPFAHQVSRQSVVNKSSCLIENYDVEIIDENGNIFGGLRNKNDLISPRTVQVDFNRMGSHTDYNSFSTQQTKTKLADCLSGNEVIQTMKITHPKTVKEIDFNRFSPRKDCTKTLVDSCADPNNIYPKHMLEKDLTGIPAFSLGTTREQREHRHNPHNNTTDIFYDYKISYDAEKCKKQQNRVHMSKSPGREAGGAHSGGMAGAALGLSYIKSPQRRTTVGLYCSGGGSGSTSSPTRGSGEMLRCDMTTGRELGPGAYDYNVKVLSRPPKKLK